MTETTKNSTAQTRKKWALLALLAALELVLYFTLPQGTDKHAPLGYVVRDGHQYTVAWKLSRGQYQVNQFDELTDALHFANQTLSLYPAHLRPVPARTVLERVWVSDMSGDFTLLWKAVNNPRLFKWTFSQRRDAQYFASAFEAGAYSQSPFGHSLLLVPKSRN